MKSRIRLFAALVLLSFTPQGSGPAHANAPSRSFPAIKSGEPDFAEIMAAYESLHGAREGDIRSWERRLKTAAFLPTLYVGYDHQIRRAESLSVADNISLSGGVVTVGPEDNDYDLDNGLGRAVRARAVWDLGETVFNRELFALANERRRRAEREDKIAREVYEIYEARHLYLARYLGTQEGGAARAAFYAKFCLLTDRINQLTANVFKDRLWRGP